MDDRGSTADPSGSAPLRAPLEGTSWRLTEYVGPDGDILAAPEDIVVTVLFADGRVSGHAGCNRYTAGCGVDGDALAVSGIATTMMACEPELMALEQAFTAALARATRYSLVGETLVLSTAEGGAVLRFAVLRPPSLSGTEWVAIGINNGRGGVASVVEGARVTAEFGDDGTLVGSGGCNRYSGRYTIDGPSLTVGPVAATRKACPAPGVMEQEAQYFTALARVSTLAFDLDRLQLRDAEGALQVDYRPTSAP